MGGWVLFPEAPVISPWQATSSWGELCGIATATHVNFANTLTNVFVRLRDEQEHLLLIGFPIPELIGGSPFCIHWQALSLPRLSTLQEARQGFSPTSKGAMKRDLSTILTKSRALKWVDSNNWNRHFWGSRGHLGVDEGLKVLIVGLGAVGSAVSEMLVRGGIENIVLIDGTKSKQATWFVTH